jgi:hypothetical protein
MRAPRGGRTRTAIRFRRTLNALFENLAVNPSLDDSLFSLAALESGAMSSILP